MTCHASMVWRPLTLPPDIERLRDQGALFVINHSAGKDSQAMTLLLREWIPARQLLVVHADLGEVEWPGVQEQIRSTIGGLPLLVCRNEHKTLLSMVERRSRWPSVAQRQCTSDLKRGPIEREIRRHLKAHPEYGGVVVNCLGIRAKESPARSRQTPFRRNERNSKAGRDWYDWLPIFDMDVGDVFATIARAGEQPHWAYQAGMSRLSCVFCIMASRSDLRTAARLQPDLYRRYVNLERTIEHTLSMDGRPLEAVTGIAANPPLDEAARY